MSDWVPKERPARVAFWRNYHTVGSLLGNFTIHGVPGPTWTTFNTSLTALEAKIIALNAARAALDALEQEAFDMDASVTVQGRAIGRDAQAAPTMTNALRQQMGITVRDLEPTPIGAPTDVPIGEVDTSKRLQQTVSFWHQDESGAKRGKPEGATGVEAYLKLGGSPPGDLSECVFVGTFTKSPFIKEFSAADANQVAHWILRWVNAKAQAGPLSETLSATVVA